MENTTTGVLLILHQGFTAIHEQDCINALPQNWQKLKRETILVKYSQTFSLEDGQDLNFTQFAYEHKQQFKREILPFIEEHKGYVIAYFGFVPVPLGIDFGHLFFKKGNIEVFQWHHKRKIWYYENDQEISYGDSEILTSRVPDPDQKGLNSVLIRLSSSYNIQPNTTNEVLPNAAEIDIALKDPDEDAVDSPKKLNELCQVLKDVLDQLSENTSDLEVIHLFAAISCGPAFLIGTKINPTVHPFIQTYQYKKTGTPKYQKAILLNKRIEEETIIGPYDSKRAEYLRVMADSELRPNLRKFCEKNVQDANNRVWPHDIVYVAKKRIMNNPFWSSLPAISNTGIENDSCSKNSETIETGAKRIKNKWHIDDLFLIQISERLKEESDIKLAFRLFFFHEILHEVVHELGHGQSEGVEFFPKVLEVADYQADVYALLNEYGFQRFCNNEPDDIREFFLNVIRVNLEMAWSELENHDELEQIQVRQFNRLLLWHWQSIQIEKSTGKIEDILKILEEKPSIELAGLRSSEQNGRFYFQLNEQLGKYLEMAIFHKNKLVRKGASTSFQIDNLINGIRQKNSQRINQELMRFNP
jgi:hypothetical protein